MLKSGKNNKFVVLEEFGTVGSKSGWHVDVSLISWHGNAPKYDVRVWDKYQQPHRGICFAEHELRMLYDILKDIFEEPENDFEENLEWMDEVFGEEDDDSEGASEEPEDDEPENTKRTTLVKPQAIGTKSCENCISYLNGDCGMIRRKVCEDYRFVGTIDPREKENWPEFGDATGFKRKKGKWQEKWDYRRRRWDE